MMNAYTLRNHFFLKDYNTAITREDFEAHFTKTKEKAGAPVRTGKYAKSWATKTTGENSHALEITVHSRNRYQLAHLLEHGHAKRGGGRVAARPHIAAAEAEGIEELERLIERSVRNG